MNPTEMPKWLANLFRREIALTARVNALQEFVTNLMQRHPKPGLPPEKVPWSLNELVRQHEEALWIQVEDSDPALAAWLSATPESSQKDSPQNGDSTP